MELRLKQESRSTDAAAFCLSLAGTQTARQEYTTSKEKSDRQDGKPLTARRTPPQPPGQTQQPWPICRLLMSKPLSPPLDNNLETTKTPSTRNRILYAQDAAPHHPVRTDWSTDR
jgi:hypothetical protein